MKRMIIALLALPAALALAEAVRFHVHHRSNGSVVSSGHEREYLLYVPKSYDARRPTPLVISLHGAGGWPGQQRDLTNWNRLADREGFLVVYPAGIGGAGPRTWGVGHGPRLTRDVRFIAELTDELQAAYNIDRSRIYANGMSNGGGMSFVLSCTLSDRIAAVGMVGAAQTLPWTWCTDGRPVPMIAFHGTADRMARYEGGVSWVVPRGLPNVSTFTANWARRNRCGPSRTDSVAPDVTRREYTNCASGASVVLYTIDGGGHTWPGGPRLPEWFAGPTSTSIDATRVMWEFFRAHRLGEKK